ncbi:hypothetical protein [Alkalihalobacillus pseudalcaliphilus]|uniref:hypothetical protein n=1 Tax=Alkalihalobacillus pseudalcaliphilus TaxID=79884 RepID=UPI00064DDF68|nr:hypothetical protein [Alkalihalobacillus pseudalcaliphilus]KMK77029.1 hypothetical protein AB990_05595 [Alkalihalobacillus pseudalcaliphilus]
MRKILLGSILMLSLGSLIACQSTDSTNVQESQKNDYVTNHETSRILQKEKEKETLEQTLSIEDSQWILGLAEDVFQKIKRHDFPSLATNVHPDKNLTFALFPQSEIKAIYERTFTQEQLTSLDEQQSFLWGVENDGDEIQLTGGEFVSEYLLKDKGEFDIHYNEVIFHQKIETDERSQLLFDAHPQAVFVDYLAESFEQPEKQQMIRFLFERVEEQWYLFAVIREGIL